jgi:hypothetical protein
MAITDEYFGNKKGTDGPLCISQAAYYGYPLLSGNTLTISIKKLAAYEKAKLIIVPEINEIQLLLLSQVTQLKVNIIIGF